MSGVKGRSGGARPNSGPKPKPVEKLPASDGQDPIEFLLSVQNNPDADPALRIRAAVAAAKLQGQGGLADRKRIRLGEGERGKYATSGPPKLKVVGG